MGNHIDTWFGHSFERHPFGLVVLAEKAIMVLRNKQPDRTVTWHYHQKFDARKYRRGTGAARPETYSLPSDSKRILDNKIILLESISTRAHSDNYV